MRQRDPEAIAPPNDCSFQVYLDKEEFPHSPHRNHRSDLILEGELELVLKGEF